MNRKPAPIPPTDPNPPADPDFALRPVPAPRQEKVPMTHSDGILARLDVLFSRLIVDPIGAVIFWDLASLDRKSGQAI